VPASSQAPSLAVEFFLTSPAYAKELGFMRTKLFSILTGALSGFIIGWIWGNAIAGDPDVGIFTSALCTIAGFIAGFDPEIRDQIGAYGGGVLGLYLGWVLNALLFGDNPVGWGMALMVAGMMGGADLGAKARNHRPKLTQAVYINVLYAGFLGAVIVDLVLLDMVFGWKTEHSVLSQAPIILISGALGGLAALLGFGREEGGSSDNQRVKNQRLK
jgi:hypothetical protein